jgi:Secretion system C-terminal sorting domain
LSPVDRVLTQKRTEVTHTEMTIEPNGDYSTVVELINASEYFKDWPKKASRFVTNKYGYTIFDAAGQVLVVQPTTAEKTESYNELKSLMSGSDFRPMAAFPIAPTGNQVIDLQNNGIAVVFLNAGKYQFIQGNVITTFDPAKSSITRAIKEGSKVVETTRKTYQTASNGNFLVPATEKVVENVNRPSGACMQSVTIKTYRNYLMEQPVSPRNATEKAEDLYKIKVFPNPAQNEVQLKFPKTVEFPVTIQIEDLQGRPLYKRTLSNPVEQEMIDISNLSNGFYTVRFETNQGRQIHKLLKIDE